MKKYEPYVSPTAELYHWGIPFMKWGQQRYQNKDGTWTEEGLRRRREREGKGGNRTTVTVTANFKPSNQNYQQPVKKEPKPYKLPKATKKRTRAEQEAIVDELLYNMNDAEIQAAIDRLNLERKYKDILLPEVEQGKAFSSKYKDFINAVDLTAKTGKTVVEFIKAAKPVKK